MTPIEIVRPVEVLRGYRAIGKLLRISPERARDLVYEGAPIYFDKDMPKAEASELWEWYKARQPTLPPL